MHFWLFFTTYTRGFPMWTWWWIFQYIKHVKSSYCSMKKLLMARWNRGLDYCMSLYLLRFADWLDNIWFMMGNVHTMGSVSKQLLDFSCNRLNLWIYALYFLLLVDGLRIPDSYDAKIAKIYNLWTLWPVIQLIHSA